MQVRLAVPVDVGVVGVARAHLAGQVDGGALVVLAPVHVELGLAVAGPVPGQADAGGPVVEREVGCALGLEPVALEADAGGEGEPVLDGPLVLDEGRRVGAVSGLLGVLEGVHVVVLVVVQVGRDGAGAGIVDVDVVLGSARVAAVVLPLQAFVLPRRT